MTNECLDLRVRATTRRLHDAVLGLAVAVIFVVPAVFGLISLLQPV